MLDRDVDLTSNRLFHDKPKLIKKSYPSVQKLKTKITGVISFCELGSVTKMEKLSVQYFLAKIGYKVNFNIAPYEWGKKCDCCGRVFTVIGGTKKHKGSNLCVECFNKLEKDYTKDNIIKRIMNE